MEDLDSSLACESVEATRLLKRRREMEDLYLGLACKSVEATPRLSERRLEASSAQLAEES
jgi:hypothetical protein